MKGGLDGEEIIILEDNCRMLESVVLKVKVSVDVKVHM